MYAELKSSFEELTGEGQIFEIETIEVRGSPMRMYKHAPGSLRDIWLSSAGFADNEYVIYQDERLTYGDAHARVAGLANWLRQAGVQPGDRVAIAMRNYPEYMLSYWAIVSIGAVVVGMNAWWVPSELEYALQDSSPKVMICLFQKYESLQTKTAIFRKNVIICARST